ncbi:MAG: EF-hand domain-containing protein, partial [Reichenbachiella sp.]
MLGPVQLKKQKHFFGIIDFDNNGTIEAEDFEAIGENICIVRDFDPDTEEYKTIMKITKDIWANLLPYIDGDEGRLDQWITFMEALLDPENLDNYKKYVINFTSMLFKMFDLNNDGYISQTEYIDLFIGMRIEVRFAPKGFRNLDDNYDGKLSHDEILHSVDEFMRSEDPKAKGNWLFGGWDQEED